jgi:hypothetical protein
MPDDELNPEVEAAKERVAPLLTDPKHDAPPVDPTADDAIDDPLKQEADA